MCVSKARLVVCRNTAILLVFEQERATTFEVGAEQEDAGRLCRTSLVAGTGSKAFKVDARNARSTEDVGRERVPHVSLNHRD